MNNKKNLPHGWDNHQAVPGAWEKSSTKNIWEKNVDSSSKRETVQQEAPERQVEFKEELLETKTQEKQTQEYKAIKTETNTINSMQDVLKGNVYHQSTDKKPLDDVNADSIREEKSKQEEDKEIHKKESKIKDSKLKLIVIALFVVLILAFLILIGIWISRTFQFGNGENNTSNYTTEQEGDTVSDDGAEEIVTEGLPTEVFNDDLNLSSYVGYWNMKGNTEEELTIFYIEDGLLEFSIWYYRLNSAEYITATLEGKVAQFDWMDENGSRIKGELIFENDTVTVSIEESDYIYIYPSIKIYNEKHDTSWEYGDYNDDMTDENEEGNVIGQPDYSVDDNQPNNSEGNTKEEILETESEENSETAEEEPIFEYETVIVDEVKIEYVSSYVDKDWQTYSGTMQFEKIEDRYNSGAKYNVKIDAI